MGEIKAGSGEWVFEGGVTGVGGVEGVSERASVEVDSGS